MKQQSGSAMLIFVLLLLPLVWYATRMVKTVAINNDTVFERELYEQQYWYGHGMLEWGCALCRTQFDELMHQITFYNTPFQCTVHYANQSGNIAQLLAVVVIEKKNESTLLVRTEVNDAKDVLLGLRCAVHRSGNNSSNYTYLIQDWTFDHA